MPNKNLKDHCEWNNQGWMYRDKRYSRACRSRTRSDGCKLKEGWPKLDIRKQILQRGWWDTGTDFTERWWMPHPWKQARFQPHVFEAVPAHCRGVELGDFRSPFPSNPNHSMIHRKPQLASTLFLTFPCADPTSRAAAGGEQDAGPAACTAVSPPDPRAGSCCRDCMAPSHAFRKLPSFRGCLIKTVGWAAWDWYRMGNFVLPLF